VKSRAGYVLAAICLLTGVGIAGWFVWTGISDLRGALTRFVVPGNVDLTLDEPGLYTIFHESESVVDGKLYTAPSIGGLRITVVGDDGKTIAVATPNFGAHYAVGAGTLQAQRDLSVGRSRAEDRPGRGARFCRRAAAHDFRGVGLRLCRLCRGIGARPDNLFQAAAVNARGGAKRPIAWGTIASGDRPCCSAL
jgi:hypothetical protein